MGVFMAAERGRVAPATAAGAARAAFLADAGRALLASLEPEVTLEAVTRLVTAWLADACVVHLAQPDGALRPVAVASADPDGQCLMERAAHGLRRGADLSAGPVRGARGGRAELLAEPA